VRAAAVERWAYHQAVTPPGGPLHTVVTVLGVVNTVIYVALALVAFLQWRRRRDHAAGWLVLAFLTLGLIVSLGRFVPAHPHGLFEGAEQRVEIELLVLFPYFLYRFATVFVPTGLRLRRFVIAMTLVLSVGTFTIPRFPAAGEPRPWWFVAYLVLFLIHWTLLSVVVTVRLWRAGRGQPGVASSRMRLLAFAAASLTVAIVGSAFQSGNDSPLEALTAGLASVAGICFLLGVAPPVVVRSLWRSREQERLQEAIRGLMTLATTRSEVADRVLGPVAGLVGAGAAAVLDAHGELLASRGLDFETRAWVASGGRPGLAESPEVLEVEAPGATFLVWTSRYAPFFGGNELRVLQTVAALTGVALDRVRLFEQEHESRLGLERANEVMANFVALAAHELRTPVTTIHGFVQTLHHLGDRLDAAQQEQLRTALEQQTVRMASLVEQLLDLSRLDAEAVDVRPQRIRLRARLQEVVAVAAGSRTASVELDAPDLEVNVDPSILDHIVTNLVTNAFRYGQPPVRVHAHVVEGSVRVSVEDSGPGVATELEDSLFERFTRAGVSRDRVAGTGLGLAIARAYARAHRGDVRYEPGQPNGARFVVDLPSV
jgi:signal transduction histidine kinase